MKVGNRFFESWFHRLVRIVAVRGRVRADKSESFDLALMLDNSAAGSDWEANCMLKDIILHLERDPSRDIARDFADRE